MHRYVLITAREFGMQLGIRHRENMERRLIDAGCRVIWNEEARAMSSGDILSVDERTPLSGILVYSSSDEIDASVLRGCKTLKAVSRHGVGIENIDSRAADERGVAIGTTAEAKGFEVVADLAFALMLDLARRTHEMSAAMRAGRWERVMGRNVCGKTLGVVGLGKIGRAVARRARGFEMEVLAYDPFVASVPQDVDATLLGELDALLETSDFVSLHCNSTPENRHMIGRRELSLMPSTSFLVNVARAPLVDGAALVDALERGAIAGAACDVYLQEPPTSDPLVSERARGLENLILTPHVASYTEESLRRMDEVAIDNIVRALREADARS